MEINMLTLSGNKPAIFPEIVNKDLCIGCGICVVVCPQNSLKMGLNKKGELIPILIRECPGKDKLCINICHQIFKSRSASNASILGDSLELSTWVGYSTDAIHRMQSSSGGILTLLLQFLLKEKIIDDAIVAAPVKEPTRLFKMALVETEDELNACAGSKYYPVEYSTALQELAKKQSRVAIVGLPCHVRALRRLAQQFPKYQNKILYIFGLVCGHGVSAQFTDYLLALSGTPHNSIDTVKYRDKMKSFSSTNFIFQPLLKNIRIGRALEFNNSGYGDAWKNRLFVPEICDFCEDVFASEADATFMDAWLEPYVRDAGGTSIIISREKSINDIIARISEEGLVRIEKISTDDVIRAQRGVIRYKKELLPSRIHYAIEHGITIPPHLTTEPIKGTRKERRGYYRFRRNRVISEYLWKLHLHPFARARLIAMIFGFNPIYKIRSIAVAIVGEKGKRYIKKMIGGWGRSND